MFRVTDHLHPVTLRDCGEAIDAVLKNVVPSLRYAADTLKANSYPLNAMSDVAGAALVLQTAADRAAAILKHAQDQARAEKGSK